MVAIIGAVLNICGRWEGFAFWLVSNGYWTYKNCEIGEYEQATIFFVFWILSFVGMIQWAIQ